MVYCNRCYQHYSVRTRAAPGEGNSFRRIIVPVPAITLALPPPYQQHEICGNFLNDSVAAVER